MDAGINIMHLNLKETFERSLMQSYWMSYSIADIVLCLYPLNTQHSDSSLLQAPATFCLRTSRPQQCAWPMYRN